MWWLALTGCPKKEAAPVGEPPPPAAPDPDARRPVAGPTRVVRAGAPRLCVDVPAGWSGTTSDGPRFLQVERDDGYAFALTVGVELPEAPTPAGFSVLFEEAGTYRNPPILPEAGTRTWTSVDPSGPLIRAWYGRVDGVPIEVAATYPLGGVTAGDSVFASFLARFCAP